MFEELNRIVGEFWDALEECGVRISQEESRKEEAPEKEKVPRMVLYLSGAITADSNYYSKFRVAHGEIGAKGHDVLNPAMLPAGMSYDKYLDIDFAMLRAADGIVMLDGWKESTGAKAELRYALAAEKKVFFGTDAVPEVSR